MDIALIERLQNDDPDAFEILFQMYHDRVYAFALRMTPCVSDAEEVVQKVFTAVWDQRRKINITTSFVSYLYGITRHMIIESIKRKLRYEAFAEYYLSQNSEYSFITEDEIFYNELHGIVSQLLREMPDRRREIFLLSRDEGLSYAEIAEKLGITENTVDTQIRNALNYLRHKLAGR